jgi:hypothetical protein
MNKTKPTSPKPPGASGAAQPLVRRRVIVDSAFQIRMVLPIVVFVVIFAILAGGFVFFPMYRNAAYDPSPIVRALLDEQVLSLHIHLWPVLIIAALVAGIYALIRSNHVASPLFELKRGLLQMMSGKYEKIQFRHDDEFREFEDIANRLALTIDSLATSNLRKTTSLEKRLKFLKSRLEVRDLTKNEILTELDDLIKEVGHVQVAGSGAIKPEEVG